ncbi:hypothetical protein [Citricoccus nitrophenolicus]|uniref:hypothetical protein n=1 Tax=Citricoccus nitrophenolicus TaxID=863575 RepID=UPI0031F0070F
MNTATQTSEPIANRIPLVIQNHLATQPDTPIDVLVVLLRSESQTVRTNAAKHPNAAELAGLLSTLSKDAAPEVMEVAKAARDSLAAV